MDKYRYLIDSAQASSSRTRAVIFLMLLACFLSAVALWNELDTSWLRNRQIAVKHAMEWFVFQPDRSLQKVEDDSLFFSGEEDFFKMWLNRMNWHDTQGVLDDGFIIPKWTALKVPKYPILPITDEVVKEIKSSASLIGNRYFYTQAQAETFLNALIQSEVDNRLSVRIPILGIVFDINDLAIISGAAFNILLFVFWFSLAREKKNIKFIFQTLEDDREAGLDIQKKVYQEAAMKQVFHIPPELPGRYSSRFDLAVNHRINNLTYPIVLLPLVVNLSIFIYDRFSEHYGTAISAELTRLQFWTSLVLLVANFLLTVMCAGNWRGINAIWYRYHDRICRNLEATHPNANA